MIEVDLKPENGPEKDKFAPEPIPTYKEWLDEQAKDIFNHWGFHLARGAIGLIKYFAVREQLFINALRQKDIVLDHEVEELFGDKAHQEAQRQGVKELTRSLMRASSQGKLIGPTGEALDPDSVLVVLNDILDLNDTGWTGRTMEVMFDTFGGSDRDLRADYTREMNLLKATNALRAKRKERAEQQIKDRAHRLKIYLSKRNIDGKPVPSEEDQQKMLDGEIPIPEKT